LSATELCIQRALQKFIMATESRKDMEKLITQKKTCHSREGGNPVVNSIQCDKLRSGFKKPDISIGKRQTDGLDPRLRGDDRNINAPARCSYDMNCLGLAVLSFSAPFRDSVSMGCFRVVSR
jgi:hypothetical protein